MDFSNAQTVDASFSTFNQVHGNQTNIVNQAVRPGVLDWLGEAIVPDALHDSACSPPPCSPDTRQQILKLISDWISDPKGHPLCWLSGHVGTGKSAIAKTISMHCKTEGRLAATFFCSRAVVDRSDGKKLIATIAYQLVTTFPSLKPLICDAIEHNRLILSKSIPDQFQVLIVDPLLRARSSLPQRVIVVDALDECDPKSAEEISKLLCDSATTHNLPLRWLITTRTTFRGHLSFQRNLSIIKSFALHDFAAYWDIGLYFKNRFSEIYENHPDAMRDVSMPWPHRQDLSRLMGMARNLFIFASSVTRFVDDHGSSPEHRLKMILTLKTSSQSAYHELDGLYEQILAQCDDKEALRLILGTVLALHKPVPFHVIGILLRTRRPDILIGRLRTALSLSGSVLHIPEDEQKPVTTYHKSFRDFLTNKTRSGESYFINRGAFENELTYSCLDLLSKRESSALLDSRNSVFNGMAFDYARMHYLTILKRGSSNDHCFEFVELVVFNATTLVTASLFRSVFDYLMTNTVMSLLSVVPIIAGMGYYIILSYVVKPLSDGGSFLGISTTFTGMCALEGGVRCLPAVCRVPVICQWLTSQRIPWASFLNLFTSGAALDMILRAMFGMDSGVGCLVSADGNGHVIRTIIVCAILDFALVTTAWIYSVVADDSDLRPQLTVTAVRIAGGAVGRAIGAAIFASIGAFRDFIPIILSLAFGTILSLGVYWRSSIPFRLKGLLPTAFKVVMDESISETDHQLYFFLHQHRCRWIKARYHYALQQHRMVFSVTVPLRYLILVLEFYAMTLKPTHVSAKTFQERLYCEWCSPSVRSSRDV